MRKKIVSPMAGMVLIGLVAFSIVSCDGSGGKYDDVGFETAQIILSFVGSFPSGEVKPTGTETEPKLEVTAINLEKPEHDHFYVLWLKDTDGDFPGTPFVPMEVFAHSGTSGVGHLHQEDLGAGDFEDFDQILISIEEDEDDSGAPDVLEDNSTHVPQAEGPELALLFSDDFAGGTPDGVAKIIEEHIHSGALYGGTEEELEHEDYMDAGSHAEVRLNYVDHNAYVHVHDLPLPPSGYHYALWAMAANGGMTMELADVDLEDDDMDGIGEAEFSVPLNAFDMFGGIMFMVTLETNEGDHAISPVVILKGELKCAPGHCAGEEPAPQPETGTGGGHAH